MGREQVENQNRNSSTEVYKFLQVRKGYVFSLLNLLGRYIVNKGHAHFNQISSLIGKYCLHRNKIFSWMLWLHQCW